MDTGTVIGLSRIGIQCHTFSPIKKIDFFRMRDYGAFDYSYAEYKRLAPSKDLDLDEMRRHEFTNDNASDKTVVMFLPWRSPIDKAIDFGWIPRARKVYAYEGPSALISAKPADSIEALDRVLEDVERKVDMNGAHVYGLSAGTFPAIHASNIFPVKRLDLVTPGVKIGKTVYSGLLTQQLKRESQELGFRTAENYDEALGKKCLSKNLGSLPENVGIYLGTHDLIVRSNLGEDLAKRIKEQGKNVEVTRQKGAGHALTLLRFGQEMRAAAL